MTREEENYEMIDQFFNPQIQAEDDLENFLGIDDYEIFKNWAEKWLQKMVRLQLQVI